MATEEPPPIVPAPDAISALFRFLDDKIEPGDMAHVESLVEQILEVVDDDDDDDDVAEDKKRRFRRLGVRPNIGILADKTRRKSTGDSAMVDRATIREWQEIREAEAETGIMGMDNVPAIYREAIRRLGRDPSGLFGNAARATYRALKTGSHTSARMAADAATIARRAQMFPHGDRVRKTHY